MIEEVRLAPDSPLEGGVSCELVSENAKFPASREDTGNFIDSGLGGASRAAKKRYQISTLRANSLSIRTGNSLPPYRELNRAIRVIFAPIRESRCRPLFRAAALPTNRIVPTDLERCREGGTGTPPDARGRRSRSPARGRFCPCERRPRHAQIARRACRRERSAFRGFTMAVVASRAARVHELTADGGPRGFESISLQQRVSDEPLLAPEPSRSASVQETTGGSTGQPKNLRGTDGSNPSPSSGESIANPTFAGASHRISHAE